MEATIEVIEEAHVEDGLAKAELEASELVMHGGGLGIALF